MKAKEYAQRLIDKAELSQVITDGGGAFIKELNTIVHEMIDEIVALQKARNIKFDISLHGVLLEHHNKWKAICRAFDKEITYTVLPESLFVYALCQGALRDLFAKYGLPKGVTWEEIKELEAIT